VPACAACDRYLAPATVRPDGTCPSCGRPVDLPERPAAVEEEPDAFPWHLKLAVGALVVYLGYRAFQGVEWVVARFF